MNFYYILLYLILIQWACGDTSIQEQKFLPIKIKGVTAVASPQPFTGDPIAEIKIKTGAEWICLVPYAFTPQGEPTVRYNLEGKQWWGETKTGIIENINLAKANNMKILLKPQVWSHGWWTGDYFFETDEDWSQWEEDYTKYITFFARLADSMQVDLFCIGTEFKKAVAARPQYWHNLSDSIREIYSGQLTYAANWDNYQNIPFWDKMDYIGIDAYFPLLDEAKPKVEDLVEAWKPWKDEIRRTQKATGKPVIFTEFGYLAVDGSAWNTWELEERLKELPVNEQNQSNAYEAMFRAFTVEPWWHGSVLWKWFPEDMGNHRNRHRDYTPQNKLAETTLLEWYSKQN